MRVLNKTDLDDSVVEDGEAATILISDGKGLTTKTRDVSKSAHLSNGLHVPNGKRPTHQPNGMVAMMTKQREPVEDCEEEEVGRKTSGGDSMVDSLTDSMKGVSIQESSAASTEFSLEGKLSELTVNDNDEEEDTRCASLQSQSSVITVDPPSLHHEEEEERGGEVAEDLAPRGPTAGKPTSFRPNHEEYNHIANKSYSTHNLDRFHNQVAPFIPPQPTNGSYMPVEFGQNNFYPPTYSMNNVSMATSGKRGMDDDEENPFKYTRPVEEMGFPGAPQPKALNDCNGVVKRGQYFTQVSTELNCGGNVVDTSLSPEEELVRSMRSSAVANIPFEHQVSFSELDNFLESFQMDPVQGVKGSARDHDPGYSSENSPPSDNTGSPGSSPKSAYSPPPPSNMSQDSGIASPYSDDNLSTIVPSPPEENGHNRAWVSGSEDFIKPQYTVAEATQSGMYPSPSSVPTYHSPPSATMYHSPASVTSVMSPGSGTMYPSPASSTMYHSPPSVTNAMSPPSVYQNPPSVASAMSPASMSMYHSPPSVTSAMSPPGMTNIISPPSVAASDDMSMTSMPSPIMNADSQNDYIFNSRRDELRDALDVIAIDVKLMNERKKASIRQPAPSPAPAQKNIPPVGANTQPAPCNIPASVTQQKNTRPEKLPIAPLPKQVRPAPGLSQQQQQQQGSPMMKGAVPVVVMPNAMAVSPVTTATAPVTASQPVLLVNSGQNNSVLVFVKGNQQNTTPAPKKKLVPIRPRPGPAISDAAPKPVSAKVVAKPEMASPKLEPNISGTVGNGVVPGSNGVHPSPSPSPANAGNRPAQGRGNPSQSRMLNVARRLVASMTTPDLQFKDTEGDTYLHVSVCKADGNMVQALLERMTRENLQSMVNTQNLMRQTPLYLAVSSNSPEMVELLIQYGADVNLFAEHTRADGRTKEVKAALHCAASNGQQYLPTLQALLAAKELNIDLVNSDGHTALHCAILEHGKADSEGGVINNLPIIQALIKHGADPNAQGKKSGKTALMYALESRDLNLIEHIVALIDPARLRIYLKTQAFDSSTCQRILENLQRSLDDGSRQRLHTCFRINSRRDNSTS